MRVLVTGSRKWTNEAQIERTLAEWKAEDPLLEIGHGASKGGGVDLFVARACEKLDIPQWPYPVRSLDGNHRGAPLNRNKRMVLTFLPAKVVGFRSEGKSNGTDQTLDFAANHGIPTTTIEEELL